MSTQCRHHLQPGTWEHLGSWHGQGMEDTTWQGKQYSDGQEGESCSLESPSAKQNIECNGWQGQEAVSHAQQGMDFHEWQAMQGAVDSAQQGIERSAWQGNVVDAQQGMMVDSDQQGLVDFGHQGWQGKFDCAQQDTPYWPLQGKVYPHGWQGKTDCTQQGVVDSDQQVEMDCVQQGKKQHSCQEETSSAWQRMEYGAWQPQGEEFNTLPANHLMQPAGNLLQLDDQVDLRGRVANFSRQADTLQCQPPHSLPVLHQLSQYHHECSPCQYQPSWHYPSQQPSQDATAKYQPHCYQQLHQHHQLPQQYQPQQCQQPQLKLHHQEPQHHPQHPQQQYQESQHCQPAQLQSVQFQHEEYQCPQNSFMQYFPIESSPVQYPPTEQPPHQEGNVTLAAGNGEGGHKSVVGRTKPTKRKRVMKCAQPPSPASLTNKLQVDRERLPPSSQLEEQGLTMFCVVCGDVSAGVHYGAMVCEGCKGFFQRSCYQARYHKLRCGKGGHCVVDKLSRTNCQACRFKKCISVGMVIIETGGYSGRKKRPVTRSKMLVDSLLAAHNSSWILPPPVYCPMITQTQAREGELGLEGCTRALYFAVRVPGFTGLPELEHDMVLNRAVPEILIMRLALRFAPEARGFLLAEGEVLHLEEVLRVLGRTHTTQLVRLSTFLMMSEVTVTELSLLCGLTTTLPYRLDPDSPHLAKMEAAFEAHLEALEEYYQRRCPDKPMTLAKILQRLSDVWTAACQASGSLLCSYNQLKSQSIPQQDSGGLAILSSFCGQRLSDPQH